MSLRHPSVPLSLRHFSTTPTALLRYHKPRLPDARASDIPTYPYAPSQWYKQSNHGLYGGTRLQFGNTVSERTEIKNRRRWSPNIRNKKLWSNALQRWLRLKVQARVLRTIDKVGGLDEYLLGQKEARVRELGVEGWRLRWRVMQTGSVRRRFKEERRALGLPEEGDGMRVREVLVGSDGKVVSEEELRGEVEEFDRVLDEKQGEVEMGTEDEDENLGKGFMGEEAAPERPRIKL